MTTLRLINKPGIYPDISLVGTNRNTDIALHVHVDAGQVVELGNISAHNVFIPLIKTGSGLLKFKKISADGFGGDFSNLRGSNIDGEWLVSRNNTPTRPYNTLIREGFESVTECLARNGESVFDDSLLSFEKYVGEDARYIGKEIIAGYHQDCVAQIYAVLDDGHTLDPAGTIENIHIANIDAEISGKNSQAIIGSEKNRYTNIVLGDESYRVLLDGYPYHAVFNQLDCSSIGCGNNEVTAGSKIRVQDVKGSEFKTADNHFVGFEGADIIGIDYKPIYAEITKPEDVKVSELENNNHRRMSDEGVKILIESEGAIPHVYKDQAGYDTIAVGHLLLPAEKMSGKIILYTGQVIDFRNGPITKDEITALLKHDLRSRCIFIEEVVTVPLNQGQFDTLIHFVFNIGNDAFRTSSLLEGLNAGDYSCVPDELRKWNKITIEVGGQRVKRVSQGLVNRRETAVCMWCAATPEVFDINGYIAGSKETTTGPIYDAPVATEREMKGIDKPEKSILWSRIFGAGMLGMGGTGGLGTVIANLKGKVEGLANDVINDPVSATGDIAKNMQDASVNAAKLLDAVNDLNIWLMWGAIFIAIVFGCVVVVLLARLDDRVKGIN